jgi:hypothetical protein
VHTLRLRFAGLTLDESDDDDNDGSASRASGAVVGTDTTSTHGNADVANWTQTKAKHSPVAQQRSTSSSGQSPGQHRHFSSEQQQISSAHDRKSSSQIAVSRQSPTQPGQGRDQHGSLGAGHVRRADTAVISPVLQRSPSGRSPVQQRASTVHQERRAPEQSRAQLDGLVGRVRGISVGSDDGGSNSTPMQGPRLVCDALRC